MFSPFVTLLGTILILVSGIVIGLRLPQYRSRWIVGISSIAFSGMMTYVYALSALPPTFVMGIAAACAVLMIPLAVISPRHEADWTLSEDSLSDDYEKALAREIPTVDCPACDTSNPVETTKRPVRIPCGGCGRNLRIEG